ncbi:MAG: hypothetical protein K1X79_05370 [Oligoflexia bacterium]|nr:hypothetical protein [Oligoflexia bacterium]
MAEEDIFLAATVAKILESRKYKDIDSSLIESLVRANLAKSIPRKEIEGRVRDKLHQIGGAFFVGSNKFDKALELLRSAAESGDLKGFEGACAKVMQRHASTAERLEILPQFYDTIIPRLRQPVQRVLDLACGLNPLALPWMGLPADTEYLCFDIYADVVELLNEFFRLAKVNGKAQVRDLSTTVPDQAGDVAFLLKAIPTLEQIDREAGVRLLQQLPVRDIIVSWPIKSLGGKNKGMLSTYSEHFEEIVKPYAWETESFCFQNEMVYLIHK